MGRFLISGVFVLALCLPAISSAELVKDFTAPNGFRYNAAGSAVGWATTNAGDFGHTEAAVYLWPATKGVAKALAKLNKNVHHTCTIEYDPDIALVGAYGIYLNTYKAKCTPLP